MKKVSGCIDVRVLGCYDFEFYIEDDMTDDEIKNKVDDVCDYYIHYDVEDGYEAVQETVYKKKSN